MDCSMPGFLVHHQLPELAETSCPLSRWCHPTISSSVVPFSSHLQSFPASGSFPMSQFFTSRSQLQELQLHIRSFSFSISPSNEYSGLIFFKMNWLDLLAVQWTLKSLLQHHSSKASILQHSAFFTGQLSRPYMTTGKAIVLTRWTFVSKVMSLLFNMLSQFSSVQLLSCVLSATPWTHAMHGMPGLPVRHQLPEFTQTCSLSGWCHPTISSSVVPFSSCP